MILKKEFNKSEFYRYRFIDEEHLYVVKIPNDFKIKIVPSYIEIDENNLMFSTVLCVSNLNLLRFLNENISEYSLYEMTTPYTGLTSYTDKESFYMFNCEYTDIALISPSETLSLSNFNAKNYGSIFLVTENKNFYLKVKLYL